MDVSTSFWLCSRLLAVVGMSVTIGYVWCCICGIDWIADCESVDMTMLFKHGGTGCHSQSTLRYTCINTVV